MNQVFKNEFYTYLHVLRLAFLAWRLLINVCEVLRQKTKNEFYTHLHKLKV